MAKVSTFITKADIQMLVITSTLVNVNVLIQFINSSKREKPESKK